jgi:hypothetical protein
MRLAYENDWIKAREDVALRPDGRTTIHGVVDAGECVGVLPFTSGGESLEQAVQRELAEDAGREAGSLVELCDFHPSKSIMRETAHLYRTGGLRQAPRPPDATAFIERCEFPFAEVLRMVERAEIKDSMGVIAILHAVRLSPS